MLWINLIGLLCLAAGFVLGWRAISRRRTAIHVEGVMLQWEENPPPAWHYDRLAFLAITVHACAAILLSILLVWSVNRSASGPFSLEFQTPINRWLESYLGIVDAQSRWLSFIVGALAAGIGAYVLGVELSFPIVRLAVRPVPVQWSASGVIHGSVSVPWEDVVRWSVDPRRQLIGLYADRPRPTLLSILHPPTEADLQAALEFLRQKAPQAEVPWASNMGPSRVLRVGLLVLGTAALVLIAFLLSTIVAEWVWFAYAVEILALGGLGLLLARA